MEFTSKQRSYLKGLASNEDAIFQIGKSSITPTMIQAIMAGPGAAVLARSLVVPNAPEPIVEPIINSVNSLVLIPFFSFILFPPHDQF